MSFKLLAMASLLFFIKDIHEVRVTVYHIKGITASGEMTTSIKVPFVAVSRDLLIKYPMHSTMIVDGCPFAGKYLVKDKMNKRLENSIDVFIKSSKKKYNPCKCKIYTQDEYELFKNETMVPKPDSIIIDTIMTADTIK